MKTRNLMAAVVALILIAPLALADDAHKCTAETQECLDLMVSSMKKRGWVGLELDWKSGISSISVTRVVSGSPAEAAGFKTGDRLVALNGIDMKEENAQALEGAQKQMMPGKQVTYRVERAGAMRELTVTLAAVPDDVMAQWVGAHMLEHAMVNPSQP